MAHIENENKIILSCEPICPAVIFRSLIICSYDPFRPAFLFYFYFTYFIFYLFFIFSSTHLFFLGEPSRPPYISTKFISFLYA